MAALAAMGMRSLMQRHRSEANLGGADCEREVFGCESLEAVDQAAAVRSPITGIWI
jgi:hypothetical protein